MSTTTSTTPTRPTTRLLELEITGRCQLSCIHCYAESGPDRAHGMMTTDDWLRVIEQAHEMGVTKVQLIGGEPTRRPEFFRLLTHALSFGLRVEVFSNLVAIRDDLWSLFRNPLVSLIRC